MNAFTVQDLLVLRLLLKYRSAMIFITLMQISLFWARHLIWRFREKQDVALDRVESAMHLPASA